MSDRNTVIADLEYCLEGLCEYCSHKGSDAPGGCKDELIHAAMVALKQITDQDLKDLDMLRRVKDGKLAKTLCRDYVIYNGEWYRNHKWDWPDNEPLEPRIIDGEPECGFCLYELRRDADSYCPCCGRKIKWE